GSVRGGSRLVEPGERTWLVVGRSERQAQRPVRAVFVAQRLDASAGSTLLESALRSERTVAAALVTVALLAWLWIAVMARDMYGPMTGASAWMMTFHWDV